MTLMNPTRRKLEELYYPELSYEITGILFKIHNELGRFELERNYCDLFEKYSTENKFSFKREKDIKKILDNIEERGNIPDFIIEDRIVIDFKNKKFITKDDYFQMVRYLDVAKLPLGFIVNFRAIYLKPKRVINSKFHSSN